MEATITGTVLETVARNFPSGDAYTEARILCGKSNVVSVNFVPGNFSGDQPRERELIDVLVRITAFARRTGAPGLNVAALSVRPAVELATV